MIQGTNSPSASSARKLCSAVARIESLEGRAYLTGAVFGDQQNLTAAAAGIAPVFINLDDVNGDGKADLISANDTGPASGNVGVLLGRGDGTFGATQTIAVPFAPLPLADADLNGDGKLDIVAGSANSNQFSVILNNGDGTFGAAQTYTTGILNTHAIAVGDFNHDGKMDIAVVSDDAGQANNLQIFLNTGSGTFTALPVQSVPHSHIAAITAITQAGQTNLATVSQDQSMVTMLVGGGAGVFTVGLDYAVGTAPVSIASADLKGNGIVDLVTANSTGGTISALVGNPNGTFQPVRTSVVAGVPAGGGPLKLRVSNLNNDGIPDLLLLLGPGAAGDAEVMLGNGDGTFHSGNIIATGGAARTAIAAGDLNADGLTDLAVADPTQVSTLLNVTNQDHTPPTAAVDITQPIPQVGSPVIQFTVTYSDNTQVDASTLGNGNLTVTNPNGTQQPALLVSTNLANGASVTATYQINAPSGAVSTADNGAYTVNATANTTMAVKDANGNPVAAGAIGQFSVTIPATPQNGPDLVAGPVLVKLPPSVVGGSHAHSAARVTIANAGNQPAVGIITVNFYASPDVHIRGNAPLLGSVQRKINLKVGRSVIVTLPRFIFPAGVNGRFFVVANVNATKSVPETNYADNVGISATAAHIAPPFVDINNLWNRVFPASLAAGEKLNLAVLLRNDGNVPARGVATITVYASPDANIADGTVIGSNAVHLGIPAGKTRNVRVRLTVPALAHGNYHMIVTVTFPGDNNLANNTAASVSTFTV